MPDSIILPAATTATLAAEIPTPVGEIPAFFIRKFGPNYRTTISGYAAGLGVILLGLVPFMTGNTAKIMGVIGTMLTGGGIQQGFQNAKDKAVSGVEPK
jgi:hypothetical protein